MRLPVQELASEAQQRENLKQRLRLRICIDDDGICIARQTMYAILCQEEVVAVRYRFKRIQKGKDRNCQLISENVVTAAKANKAGIAPGPRSCSSSFVPPRTSLPSVPCKKAILANLRSACPDSHTAV